MPAAAEAGFDASRLQAYLDRLAADIERRRFPGAVLLLVRHGRVALFEALGRLGPDADTPMPRDALFRIQSMTKPIVSAAALRLIEQGRLHAAEPVAKHLPAFAQPLVGAERVPAARAMTVHDLLRHTAGFGYEFNDGPVAKPYANAGLGARDRSNAEFAETLGHLPLAREPGSAWQYSRATDLLGRLIEVVAGEPLGVHLKRSIFDPLGMRDTGFVVPPDERHRIAEPYPTDADSGAPVVLPDPCAAPRFESGGGGLVSTAADYGRFLRLLTRGGGLDGVRLLGRKTVQWMTADHLGALPRVGSALPAGWGFGLGVAVRTAEGIAVDPGSAGSYGWSGAAGTIFVVDPAEDLVGLLMVQAPLQCDRCWALFRQMVYAALI